jgi:metal-responsive CopG/Arc/MetJ family transcriptional regulator
MLTQKKMGITIDKDLFEAIDKAAQAPKITRSKLAQKAIHLWFRQKTEMMMSQGYEDMASEDKEIAELSFTAQREILP